MDVERISQPPYSYLELVGSHKHHKYVMYLCNLQCVIYELFCVYNLSTIDIKYHFVRYVIDGSGVDLKKVHTK